MSIFEIRIYATPIDYQELPLDILECVFTAEMVKLRNFDNNELSSPFGPEYFSIFYTPEIYVITYHFIAPKQAGFRNQNVHLSVAIKRGFKLCNTLDVLKQLKQQFKQLATKEKTDIVRTIHTHTAELNHLVESNLCPDPDQLFINWASPSIDSKAIIAFDQEEDLSKLLDSPMRNEFKLSNGSGIVYIVYREVAAKAWPKIKNDFAVIQMEGYDFKRTFEVVFPDGAICIVSSMGEELDYVCTKPFYKPYHFKGTLLQHITDWKITQNVDKTQFTIGLSLEPEEKKWKLHLINSTGESVLDKSIILETSLGIIEGNALILKGDEIGNANNLLLTSPNPQWIVVEQPDLHAEEINVKIKQIRQYNLAPIFQHVIDKYKFSPVITLHSRNNEESLARFNQDSFQKYVDLPYNEAFIVIEENERFEACKLFFNSNGGLPPFTLEKKAMSTLNFEIANKYVKRRMSEGEKVLCRYCVGEKCYEKALSLDDCEILELPVNAIVKFRLEFPGFKTYEGEAAIHQIPRPVFVHFSPAFTDIAWRFLKIAWLYILFFGCGVGVGLTIDSNKSISREHQFSVIIDSLVNEKRRLVSVVEAIRDSVMMEKKKKEEAMKQSEESESLSYKIDCLVKKMQGNDYTWSDINQLRTMLSNREQYRKQYELLIRDAELCLRIVQNEDREIDDMHYLHGDRKFHREFKKMILTIRKDKEIVRLIRKHNCRTLREMMDVIEKYKSER